MHSSKFRSILTKKTYATTKYSDNNKQNDQAIHDDQGTTNSDHPISLT